MIIKRNFTSEQELKEILDSIYENSKKGKGFNGILEAAFNETTIITAIHNIKSNKGAGTAGIDGFTMDNILQMERNEVISLVQKSVYDYKPNPVRRTYIKKANGKLRPLGIPCVIDKIIQECIKIIIEPICEAKFYPKSYGFRPYRSTQNALRETVGFINPRSNQKPTIVIEGDIESYFDNINHRILLRKLYRIGIKDKRILAIIKSMLKAGYLYYDKNYETTSGAVQGGVISPLLANVYLNDLDWMIGRMYHFPKTKQKYLTGARQLLRGKGVRPKYLVRYCDDWVLMTTDVTEATRMLKYLNKYFKYRLKLSLSKEKTLITDITKTRVKFLGFELLASKPRSSPKQKGSGIVGKFFPDKEKCKKKMDNICDVIKKLRGKKTSKDQVMHIEKINSMITGLAEYYKTSICTYTYRYMDRRIYRTSRKIFKVIFGKTYKNNLVELKILSNRPQRHEKRKDKTFAIKHEDMWIGLTKAYLTHSQREKFIFDQKLTPYSDKGRKLKQRYSNKRIPMDRPPLYESETLNNCIEIKEFNFEYYMNREYAYNRDKGRCRICNTTLTENSRFCYHKNKRLSISKINKVSNLVWLCTNCLNCIKENYIPDLFGSKEKSKLKKYLNVEGSKLSTSNL